VGVKFQRKLLIIAGYRGELAVAFTPVDVVIDICFSAVVVWKEAAMLTMSHISPAASSMYRLSRYLFAM
jgi:hypothetical protein